MTGKGSVSDGYHTFDELYEHRHALFGVVVRLLDGWKSRVHSDGTSMEGWFIAGVNTNSGQVTYHLPDRLWYMFPGRVLDAAPEWDGHTHAEVVLRLKSLW